MTNKIGKTLLNVRKWRVLRAGDLVCCSYIRGQTTGYNMNKWRRTHVHCIYVMLCYYSQDVLLTEIFTPTISGSWLKIIPARSFSTVFFFWKFQTPSGNGINFTFFFFYMPGCQVNSTLDNYCKHNVELR